MGMYDMIDFINMSEYDDWQDDGFEDYWGYPFEEPTPPLPTKWKTKDGQVLPITEMDTGHIQNCIRLLQKHKPESRSIDAFRNELARREQAMTDKPMTYSEWIEMHNNLKYQREDVKAQAYGDYMLGQWPPGRPISEYRPEMGEVFVKRPINFKVGGVNCQIFTFEVCAPCPKQIEQWANAVYWLLPGSEGG